MKFTIREISTASNFLSILRLILAIPLWFLFDYLYTPGFRIIILFACLFTVFTDTLDGYLARRFNQVTEFGKIIDPLADKVVVGIVIIKLFTMSEIPFYYLIMILGRDILIFLGGIIVTRKINRVLPSNVLGKLTVINISLVVIAIVIGINKDSILYVSLFDLSIILMIASLIAYFIRATEFLKRKKYESV